MKGGKRRVVRTSTGPTYEHCVHPSARFKHQFEQSGISDAL